MPSLLLRMVSLLLPVSNYWMHVLFRLGFDFSYTCIVSFKTAFCNALPVASKIFSQVSTMIIRLRKWSYFLKKSYHCDICCCCVIPMDRWKVKLSVSAYNLACNSSSIYLISIGLCIITTAIYFFTTPLCLEIIWF